MFCNYLVQKFCNLSLLNGHYILCRLYPYFYSSVNNIYNKIIIVVKDGVNKILTHFAISVFLDY